MNGDQFGAVWESGFDLNLRDHLRYTFQDLISSQHGGAKLHKLSDSFTVAANTNGLNDGSNATALASLADAGVLDGGDTSVVASYANLTAQIGSAGSEANAELTTQTNLFGQAESSQQSLAGVNLNQEAANLVQFQQAYQASAQVISTAQQIFTSLITAIQDG